MVTFSAGWLKAHESLEADWKELVATVCAVARLALDGITNATHRVEAETALGAAEDWAAGGTTTAEEVVLLGQIVKARYEDDEEVPGGLDGVWSACMYAAQVP